LGAAFGRERIKFCATIVFGGTVGGADPFALDEAMARGIERALLDLQDFIGAEFDGFGDGVAVRGAEHKRAENQQVERALEHFDAVEFVFSRHSRWRLRTLTSNVKGSIIKAG